MTIKKAQVKMFETVAVLVVFFFMFAFGMIFYVSQQKSSAEANLIEGFELGAIDVVQVISSMPELQCSTDNIVKENCFELEKIFAFKSSISTSQTYYYSLLRSSLIEIDVIYPTSLTPPLNPAPPWTIYDNNVGDYREASHTLIPVSIYHAAKGEYYAATLKVIVYR